MEYKDFMAVLFIPLIIIVLVVTYASFEAPLLNTFDTVTSNDTFIGQNVTGTTVNTADTLNFLDHTGILNVTDSSAATVIKIWTNFNGTVSTHQNSGGFVKGRQINRAEYNYTDADTILITNKSLNNSQLLAEYTYREGSAYNSAVKSKDQGWNALNFSSVLPIILAGVFIILVVVGSLGIY